MRAHRFLPVAVMFLAQLANAKGLVVYAYDSFVGKHSLGALVAERFKTKTKQDVEYRSFGSAGELVNQLVLEKSNHQADVIVGIDQSMAMRVLDLKILAKWPEKDWRKSVANPTLSPRYFELLPYDFGYLAFVYDSRRTGGVPRETSLDAFVHDPRWKKRMVIEDPRTSSIGFNFLSWMHAVIHDLPNFYVALKAACLTFTPGWSAAYGLFQQKEADFVLSYTTSPAYHMEKESDDHFRALAFREGHYRQIETVALAANSKNPALAKQWIELLLSREVQQAVATTQWMYPIRGDVSLPASYEKLVRVARPLEIAPEEIEKSRKAWLADWNRSLKK